jgi:hypothetical protein
LQTDVQHLGVFYQEERASHHARVDQVRDTAGTDLSIEDLLKRFVR